MSQTYSAVQPQISFVIPVYNVQSYLERCLDSVIRANVEKEIILIDDGSTDGSRAILEEYQQKYPYITLVCQNNSGVSAARNIGIKLAKGRYLQFIDPDDYLLTADYAMLLKLADITGCEIFRGQYQQFIDGKIYLTSELVFNDLNQAIVTAMTRDFLNEALKKTFLPSMWRHIYKTSYIHKHNIYFNETLKAAEDTLFMLDVLMAENVKITEINLPTYAYFIREGSAATTFDFKHFESLFRFCNMLNEKYKTFKALNKVDECNWLARVIVYNYNFAYQCYKAHSNELRTSVKHFFTSGVIYSLESSYGYKVEL